MINSTSSLNNSQAFTQLTGEMSKRFVKHNGYPTFQTITFLSDINVINHLREMKSKLSAEDLATRVKIKYEIKRKEYHLLGHQFTYQSHENNELQKDLEESNSDLNQEIEKISKLENEFLKSQSENKKLTEENLKLISKINKNSENTFCSNKKNFESEKNNETLLSELKASQDENKNLKRKYEKVSLDNDYLDVIIKKAKRDLANKSEKEVRDRKKNSEIRLQQSGYIYDLSKDLDDAENLIENKNEIINQLLHKSMNDEITITNQKQVIFQMLEKFAKDEVMMEKLQKIFSTHNGK